MDTSETYIKMHLALPKELQERPCEGDYFYDTEKDETPCGRMGEVYFDTNKMIKLYEQDQLQEMVGDYKTVLDYIGGILSNIDSEPYLFKEPFSVKYIESFLSMEQLWLAFVMKEKYNKAWNGEDWVEQK